MSPERPPWDQPPWDQLLRDPPLIWDQHVGIWNTIADTDDDGKLRVPLRMIHQANDGSLGPQPPYRERRLGFEVHEVPAGERDRKLKAFAYDQ